jgi:hypothetical protein
MTVMTRMMMTQNRPKTSKLMDLFKFKNNPLAHHQENKKK